MFSLSKIIELLIQYKYFILFPIVVVEGPIVTVIAGFVSSIGYMGLFAAYVIVVFGDLTGDALYYVMGRWGRERFLNRWGKYIGLSLERVVSIEKHFEKHGSKTLLIGKLAHGIGAIFLVAAGLVKMPFSKFIFANFTATLIKSLALLLIGYFFGKAIIKINSILEFISAISISVGIIVVLAFFYYRKKKADNSYE